jgi:uncharacterized protein Smg (DUF494 family)
VYLLCGILHHHNEVVCDDDDEVAMLQQKTHAQMEIIQTLIMMENVGKQIL